MTETLQPHASHGNRNRIRFVEQATPGDVVLMTFKDPAPRTAVLLKNETASGISGDILEVMLLAPAATLQTAATRFDTVDAPPPIFVKYRGVELTWHPGHALLQCEPEQADSLLLAVVEFAHFERELRRIEDEIARTWTELEQDKSLAFDVTTDDLKRSAAVGARMAQAFQRRIRYARIEPHLYEPEQGLPATAQKLGAELRERARIEARLETVDGQLEVFEHIYEMTGQRMGEYRAAHDEHKLEWIIIVLLAAEALIMLSQTLWRLWD